MSGLCCGPWVILANPIALESEGGVAAARAQEPGTDPRLKSREVTKYACQISGEILFPCERTHFQSTSILNGVCVDGSRRVDTVGSDFLWKKTEVYIPRYTSLNPDLERADKALHSYALWFLP